MLYSLLLRSGGRVGLCYRLLVVKDKRHACYIFDRWLMWFLTCCFDACMHVFNIHHYSNYYNQYFSALQDRTQNYDLNFRKSSIKIRYKMYLTSLLLLVDWYWCPLAYTSEPFRIVRRCKLLTIQWSLNALINSSLATSFLYFYM